MKQGVHIALTGGIACGKSRALAFFGNRGFRTYSADVGVHRLLNEDEAVRSLLRDRFGAAIFLPEGEVDRTLLASRVFNDSETLKWLESCLHPRVKTAWEREIQNDSSSNWVIEIPLLFEKNLEKPFNFTVCVACLPVTQVHRLLQKGLSRLEMEARLRLHLPIQEKMRRADCVLWNEGTLDWLNRQVASWSDRL